MKKNELAQKLVLKGIGSAKLEAGYQEICRKAAAEGIVLLKNENQILPLSSKSCVSVFGRVQIDYFSVGYGSGGDVKFPYKVNLLEGLRNCPKIQINEKLAQIYEIWCKEHPIVETTEWASWPRYHEEMPLTEELLAEAKKNSDLALIVIGRAAGEDRDNCLEAGGYYLTEIEKDLLKKVSSAFERVIVLVNSGNLMDFSFILDPDYQIDGLLAVWQGGMESGNAIADVLCGDVNPCGRLADTIAKSYEDYPGAKEFGRKEYTCYIEDIFPGYRYFETFQKEPVLYPFGFGLSYTSFSKRFLHAEQQKDGICMSFEVTNTGTLAGKEVLEVYCACPRGKLGKPALQLAGFGKTDLLPPLDSQILSIFISWIDLSSYDEEGVTGEKSAYVLEKGNYRFFLGENVRDLQFVYLYELTELEVLRHAEPIMPIKKEHCFLHMAEGKAIENQSDQMSQKPTLSMLIWKESFCQEENRKQRILERMPKEIPFTGEKGYKLSQVESGEISLEKLIGQLTAEELELLTRGDITMDSSFGPSGNAGAFGGISKSLQEKGIAPILTTDGPSGIRLLHFAALLPCGTNLACSWDRKLIQKLTEFLGREMESRGTDVLLGPGVNLHRNPLCGRNFEYFSEDPVLSGYLAAAFVNGIQSQGKAACPKHFACNNQESYRSTNDARITERALREIYLRTFEICVRESSPLTIMTSYNKINGIWNHYNYDLCTTVLRKEWGYTGTIITDWWMEPAKDPDFEAIWDSAYRVRAQVDVLMPGGLKEKKEAADDSLLKSYQAGGISLAEMQRSAKNVLQLRIKLNKNKRK